LAIKSHGAQDIFEVERERKDPLGIAKVGREGEIVNFLENKMPFKYSTGILFSAGLSISNYHAV